MRTKLKFIKNVIYKLKRSYGLPIDYYQLVEHDVDPPSGEKTSTLTRFRIHKAVVLRAREFRSFVYDLAYISANKDFTTGGFFDPEDRKVIIDCNDLTVGLVPQIDDYFIFQDNKYEVKEVTSFENDYAFILSARKLSGAPIVRIESTMSVMDLTQSASAVIQDRLERSIGSELTLTQELTEVV